MQTPVVSTILVIGTTQLVAPTFSFVSTMKPHCRGMRQNPVVPALVAIISLVWTVCLLYPNGFSEDLLLQRHLPFRFRIKLLCCTAASMILLAVLARTVQWLNLHAKPIRKLSAGTYIPTSSEMGGTLIGCKSYDGRDAVFRRTASTDVGDWLRRTASIVTDMTRLLPGQRPSNRVAQDMELMPV